MVGRFVFGSYICVGETGVGVGVPVGTDDPVGAGTPVEPSGVNICGKAFIAGLHMLGLYGAPVFV